MGAYNPALQLRARQLEKPKKPKPHPEPDPPYDPPYPDPHPGEPDEPIELEDLKLEAVLTYIPTDKIKRLQVLSAKSRLLQKLTKMPKDDIIIRTEAQSFWKGLCKAAIWPLALGTRFTYEQARMAICDIWNHIDEYSQLEYIGFSYVIQDIQEEEQEPNLYAAGYFKGASRNEIHPNETDIDEGGVAEAELDRLSASMCSRTLQQTLVYVTSHLYIFSVY